MPFNHPAQPRVLIVDDQSNALKLVQLRLQPAGFQCFTAKSGLAALEILETEAIDIIFLDIMMPEMDGFEVCHCIKTNEKTKDIPVIFLSAKFEVADRVKGLELGGHDFLCKPVEQQELIARTRAAYRVKWLQDELKQLNCIQENILEQHWDKCLGQLAASLAHEINNPLAVALGNAELLKIGIATCHAKTHINKIESSLKVAADKLKSLLAIANFQGKQVFKIKEIVDNVITLTNYNTNVKKVSVNVNSNIQGKWYGSPTYIARVVLYIINYLMEKCANTTNSSITIEEEFKNDRYYLSLSNNSEDPCLEASTQIFDPFTSTGIYLAKKIIQNENGQLTLKEKQTTPGIKVLFWLPSD